MWIRRSKQFKPKSKYTQKQAKALDLEVYLLHWYLLDIVSKGKKITREDYDEVVDIINDCVKYSKV